MSWLDHKIPPPFVLLAVAFVMLGSQWWFTGSFGHGLWLYFGGALCLTGFALAFTGLRTLIGQRTTPSPRKIDRAKKLVTDGLYRFSRNPMYLGMTLFLLGVACLCGDLWQLMGPLVFVAYIQQFQIKPEERVMRMKFGDDYLAYQARVRRWI